MRLSIRFLGLDLLTLEASTDEDEAEDDKARDLSGGTLSASPVGFVARWDATDDADLPDRA